MISKRTKDFKRLFSGLSEEVQRNARKQFALFLENRSHPSLRMKLIGSTRNKRFRMYDVTVGMGYRATYFKDGDVFVWFWIGTHNSFDTTY
jgi:hypothetical protein